jgi:hypothetical protein
MKKETFYVKALEFALHLTPTSIVRMGSKMTGPVPEPISKGMFMPVQRWYDRAE